MNNIPDGYCHCGCGNVAPVATYTHRPRGWIKGKPKRFISGHNSTRRTPEYIVEDRGYETPCWIWQGCFKAHEYGGKRVNGKFVFAHRHYYEQAHGSIPRGMQIDHLCRAHSCVNPDHLEAVSCADNIRRGNQTKLTVEKVREIRRLDSTTSMMQKDIAAMFGVTGSAIRKIVTRQRWKDV